MNDKTEFDKFSKNYNEIQSKNIGLFEENNEYFDSYKIKIASSSKFLNRKNNLNILDYGCGIGNSTPYLLEYFEIPRLYGIDISEKGIEEAEKKYGSYAKYKVYDGIIIPYEDEKFDIVYASCVFHHIPSKNQHLCISEIYRVLKSGGLIIIFEHNPFNPLTRHFVNKCPFDENAILITPGEMNKKINSRFSLLESSYSYFFPSFLSNFRWMEKYLKILPFGGQYYIVAKK